MSEVAKQRLVGTLLVLLAIIVSAFFLIENANNHAEAQNEQITPAFNLDIETVDDNVVLDELEILVDPHNLGSTLPSEVKAEKSDKSEVKLTSANFKIVTLKKPRVERDKEPIVKVVKSSKETAPVQKSKKINANQARWIIQLASFRVKGKAQALQIKVKALGYKSAIEPVKNSDGTTFYRLRIGPELNEKEVSIIVRKIKQHLNLTSQIIKISLIDIELYRA